MVDANGSGESQMRARRQSAAAAGAVLVFLGVLGYRQSPFIAGLMVGVGGVVMVARAACILQPPGRWTGRGPKASVEPPTEMSEPVELDYATRSTPTQSRPPSRFNILDFVQVSIVVAVALAVVALMSLSPGFRNFLRWFRIIE
jgi:hypothetical protein